MPDMQTALTNALKITINNWEEEDMQTTNNTNPVQGANYTRGAKAFGITNNVTRATFEFVKTHPNLTSAEICAEMEKRGYKESSVSSLIAQFAVQGLAERDDRGRYITIVPEYRPLKAKKKKVLVVPKPVEEQPKRKYTKKDTTGIGALLSAKLEAAPEPAHHEDQTPPIVPSRKGFVSLVRNRTPEDILKDMTVYQARELYVHLKEMFGG